MTTFRRLTKRPIFLLLVFAALLLTACGARGTNTSWPGLSTDGELLYLANGPVVTAYDADTQAIAWQYPAEDNVNPSLLFFAPPSAKDDRIIFGDYGASSGMLSPKVTVSVYAVDSVNNGAVPPELWKESEVAFDKIVASPLQVGDVVYIGTADNLVIALDANSGDPLWDAPFEAGHSIWGQPALRGDVLYVTSLDRALHALDARTGQELWKTEFEGAIASRPVLNESLVYVGEFGSQVHAIDSNNGTIVWSAPAENWVWGAPAYAEGAVYYADIDGNVFSVDGQSGDPRWRAQVEGAVQTQPLVVDGIVYIASEGTAGETPTGALTAFDAGSGNLVWRAQTNAPLFTAPVAIDDAVVVAMQSESSILNAYDLQTGAPLWDIAPPADG